MATPVRKTVFTESDAYKWKNDPYRGEFAIPFETYKEMFKSRVIFKRENGILEARLHTDGGEFMWGGPSHKLLHFMFTICGWDHDNEVFILGATGKDFFRGIDRSSRKEDLSDTKTFIKAYDETTENAWRLYEYSYYDGTNNIEGAMFDLEIPSIGIWNGAAFHSDIFLFTDITLATEDAWTTDMHFRINMVPGDGIQIAWRELMGRKRFAYAELTGEIISARKALRYGMINEIQPDLDACYKRAWEIAELIMLSGTRVTRRITTQILRAPWKTDISWELRNGFSTEMYVTATENSPHDNAHWIGAKQEAAAVLAAEKKGKIVRPRVGPFIEEDEIK
ncbi:MAG: enoyl-CoA hydratase/isomerase family protein [Oscillospiraceae bacterium]|jgi:enoyl-CoA hydratase/carnithine racemase